MAAEQVLTFWRPALVIGAAVVMICGASGALGAHEMKVGGQIRRICTRCGKKWK